MRFSHPKHTEGCFKRFVWTISPCWPRLENLANTLLGGLGFSYEKGLGLGVATPPNITLAYLISLILDYGGPKTHN